LEWRCLGSIGQFRFLQRCCNVGISLLPQNIRQWRTIVRVGIRTRIEIKSKFENYGAKMKHIQTLLAWILLASSAGMPIWAAAPASLEIVLSSEPNSASPIVHITFRNLQAHPLQVNCSGAFFDYDIRLIDPDRHPVRMTREAHDIRSGRGVIVMSASIVTLNQNETQQDDLDLARYFDLSSGGPYALTLVRVLAGSGGHVASNSLVIRTK
jgi:hypothetical protein